MGQPGSQPGIAQHAGLSAIQAWCRKIDLNRNPDAIRIWIKHKITIGKK
jgi:hypothetical protein